MKIKQTKSYKTFQQGLWDDNPTFRMVLGICSTLAVTNSVRNSIAMSVGVIFVITSSSFTVSVIRKVIPKRARMAVYTMIIATFVILVDQYLKAFFPDISRAVGPYVGLIITNCIIMGRAEAFASSNKPYISAVDAFGVGCGYAFSLVLIAVVRELLGFGTLMGINILGEGWTNWVVMVMAPGAFIVLGVFIWIFRSISLAQVRK